MNANNIFSSSESATAEVPQGSFLNPFILNNFLSDLFVFVPNAYLSDGISLYWYDDSLN